MLADTATEQFTERNYLVLLRDSYFACAHGETDASHNALSPSHVIPERIVHSSLVNICRVNLAIFSEAMSFFNSEFSSSTH